MNESIISPEAAGCQPPDRRRFTERERIEREMAAEAVAHSVWLALYVAQQARFVDLIAPLTQMCAQAQAHRRVIAEAGEVI